jgi:hypothetical protein
MACDVGAAPFPSAEKKTVGFPVRERAIEGHQSPIAPRDERDNISVGPHLAEARRERARFRNAGSSESGSGNNATRSSSNRVASVPCRAQRERFTTHRRCRSQEAQDADLRESREGNDGGRVGLPPLPGGRPVHMIGQQHSQPDIDIRETQRGHKSVRS